MFGVKEKPAAKAEEVTPAEKETPSPVVTSAKEAEKPATTQSAIDAWSTKERSGTSAGWDISVIGNVKKRYEKVGRILKKRPWRQMRSFTKTDQGHLRDMIEKKLVQTMWDDQGMPYHATLEEKANPKLLNSEQIDALHPAVEEKAPAATQPAAPVIKSTGDLSKFIRNHFKISEKQADKTAKDIETIAVSEGMTLQEWYDKYVESGEGDVLFQDDYHELEGYRKRLAIKEDG